MNTRIELSNDVYLRHFTSEDATELFSLVDTNRNYLSKFLEWPRKTNSVDDSTWFISHTKTLKEKDIDTYGIYFKNELAGVVGYNDYDKTNNKAPLGYWLGEKFQGIGLITMSVKYLITNGFQNMGLNRIELNCAVENIPSQKVAERLNFSLEGIARSTEVVGGRTLDHKVYALIREDLLTTT